MWLKISTTFWRWKGIYWIITDIAVYTYLPIGGWMSLRMSQFKLQKSRKTQQLWHLLSWSQGYGRNWKYVYFSIVYIRKLFFLRLHSQMFTCLAFKKDRKITFWETEEALYPAAPDKDGGAGECHSKNSENR